MGDFKEISSLDPLDEASQYHGNGGGGTEIGFLGRWSQLYQYPGATDICEREGYIYAFM